MVSLSLGSLLLLLSGGACASIQDGVSIAYPKPTELFYEQKLDHFTPGDERRWSQRYLINKDNWNGSGKLANGCPGPILLYTGNEGSIAEFWQISGFVVQDLASKFGGLLLFPEERYYGKSLPFGDASFQAENLKYLTTAQVLKDYVELVSYLKNTTALARNCPVVAFGGSYGGTLTALLRATYPETVIGGLAASSELGYYDLEGMKTHGVGTFTFEDIVVATWKNSCPGCLDAVLDAIHAINDANESYIVDIFNVCEPKALGPGPKSTLFAYVLEGMPQGDYPSDDPSLNYPVTQACEKLIAAQNSNFERSASLIRAASEIAKSFFDSPPCLAYNIGGPGNIPGDGPGLSAWGYQSCTEVLHAFSAHTIRSYDFSLPKSTALCDEIFNGTVRPNMMEMVKMFKSGYSLAEGTTNVTNLIWSQGTLDPWHGWFQNVASPPAGAEVYHFIMENSAHHTDLRAPSHQDPTSVKDTRLKEEEIIRRWIDSASAVSVWV